MPTTIDITEASTPHPHSANAPSPNPPNPPSSTAPTTNRARVIQPWEKRRTEPALAYRCFRCYLELPQGKRSLVDAYRIAYRKPHVVRSPQFVGKWASLYEWKHRAELYDAHLVLLATQEAEQRIKDAAAEWEKRGVVNRDVNWRISSLARQVSLLILNNAALACENKQFNPLILNPGYLAVACTLAKTAADLSSAALNLPASRVAMELSGPNGTPISIGNENEDVTERRKRLIGLLDGILANIRAGSAAQGDGSAPPFPNPDPQQRLGLPSPAGTTPAP